LWLKQRRQALNLTQADLARCVGYSVAAIRKIEADERRPSRQVAELLADCLDIPLAERPTFLKVVRAELRVERLGEVTPASRLSPQPEPETSTLLPPHPSADQLRTQPASRHNLPTPSTPLIGREHELASLAQLLQNPQCRLLTLVGPGGIGKTRLALEAASKQREGFADGVYFVSLAPLSASAFIVPTIADAIGFALYGPTDPRRQLLTYLREKSMLLVLDNFEHLLTPPEGGTKGGAELLVDLLQQAVGVKLLVTSRELLHLQGEWVFEIQGLPVAPGDRSGELEEYSTALLFLQSAQRAHVGFVLSLEQRPAVARICRLVEGMPLGIELAAAWVRTLSCQEIVQEIERNLDFLAVSARDAPARHRSIRAVFDHSWKLLSADEQRVMQQLSLFRGGFRREAAEQVAGATLPLLSALVNKSLLRRTKADRYELHELLRQYAAEKLQGEEQALTKTCARHSSYYLALLQQREQLLKSSRQNEVVTELAAEIDNIRLAWDWAVAHRQGADILQAIGAWWWFYELRGTFHEAIDVFGRAAKALQAQPTAGAGGMADALPDLPATAHGIAWAHTLTFQAFFLHRAGQEMQAKMLLQQSFTWLQPLHEGAANLADLAPTIRAAFADTILCLGWVALRMGQYDEARAYLRDSLALNRLDERRWSGGVCLSTLGVVAYVLGEYQEAQALLREALVEWRVLGDPRNTSAALTFLGAAIFAQGNAELDGVQKLLQESLVLGRTLGDRYVIGITLNCLGLVAQAKQEQARAQSLFSESLALFKEIDDQYGQAETFNYLGHATYALEDYTEAQRCFRQGLLTAMAIQAAPIALDALVGLAMLRAQEGAGEAALEWVTHILQHPASTPEARERAGQFRAKLEAQLTPQQLEAVRARVQLWSFEAVVKEILDPVATGRAAGQPGQ
jgi:predicted ATPase/transcriptional regulator with XRE-family HTH domain